MSVYLNTENVAQLAMTTVVTHNLNNVNAIVARAMANWLTSIRVVSRAADTVTLGFSDQAPASAQLDVRVIS